jgi:hypothetical protein
MPPTDNNMSDEAPPGANGASKASRNGCRGAGYSKAEDLLICKAFISRSEDSIVGYSQKGKDFKVGMHRDYKELLAGQSELQAHNNYASSSVAFCALHGPQATGCNLPITYPERTADSIYARFKDIITPRVIHFLAIEEPLPRDTGMSSNDHFQLCKAVYTKRFPKHGNFDNFRECKD